MENKKKIFTSALEDIKNQINVIDIIIGGVEDMLYAKIIVENIFTIDMVGLTETILKHDKNIQINIPKTKLHQKLKEGNFKKTKNTDTIEVALYIGK